MRSELGTITLSEVDWNEQSPKEVEEKGLDASPIVKYRASKALAEKGTVVFLERGAHIDGDLKRLGISMRDTSRNLHGT